MDDRRRRGTNRAVRSEWTKWRIRSECANRNDESEWAVEPECANRNDKSEWTDEPANGT